MTVAFTNCEAMRNLVTVRVVPQSAPQVTAKPPGPDLGMGSDREWADQGMGPDQEMALDPGLDRGMEADKARAGASNVAGLATVEAYLTALCWCGGDRDTAHAAALPDGGRGNGEMPSGALPASTAAANLRMGKAQRWNGAPLKMTPKSLRLARCIRTIGAHSRWSRLSSPAFLAARVSALAETDCEDALCGS